MYARLRIGIDSGPAPIGGSPGSGPSTGTEDTDAAADPGRRNSGEGVSGSGSHGADGAGDRTGTQAPGITGLLTNKHCGGIRRKLGAPIFHPGRAHLLTTREAGDGNPPVGRAVRFPPTPSKPAKAASEGTGHSMQALNGLSQPFGLPSERGIAASADAFQAMSFCLRAVRASPVQLGRWTDHKNVIRPRETAWCPCLPTARANLPPAALPGCGICGCHFSL